jgi:hypothetical protein
MDESTSKEALHHSVGGLSEYVEQYKRQQQQL